MQRYEQDFQREKVFTRASEGCSTEPWVSGDRTGGGWRGEQGPYSTAVSAYFIPSLLGEHLHVLNQREGEGRVMKERKFKGQCREQTKREGLKRGRQLGEPRRSSGKLKSL